MFDAYEFTFDGESSYQYGLMIYDFDGTGQSAVSFGNKASITETRTINRIQPIHLGVNYHEDPLEFTLVFGSQEPIDRYEMENIALWLTGHQNYKWLSIDQCDLDNVQFRCLITDLQPLHHGWLPTAFEATVRCDCPYAYGYPFEETYTIDGTTTVLFRNDSSVREYIKPDLYFVPQSGTTEFSIVNLSDANRTFQITGIPSGAKVSVSNLNGIIQDETDGYNLYGGFNNTFFRLVHGDNELEITGSGALTISGRLLYNVAG